MFSLGIHERVLRSVRGSGVDQYEGAMETLNGCVEDPQPAEPGLSALVEALNSRERALTELRDVVEGQVAGIGGVVLVLRALIDVLLDEEQRAMLMSHLTLPPSGNHRRAEQSIVDMLFD